MDMFRSNIQFSLCEQRQSFSRGDGVTYCYAVLTTTTLTNADHSEEMELLSLLGGDQAAVMTRRRWSCLRSEKMELLPSLGEGGVVVLLGEDRAVDMTRKDGVAAFTPRR